MIRAFILLVILTSLGWWLDREHQAGRFQRVDELFLDFLVANARDRFEKASPSVEKPVVLVKMRVADKEEYAGWPPRPLDWQMVLKGLQPFDPAVLVIPETLMWGSPSPEFVREAAEALMPFPSTVLGVEAQLATGANSPAFLGGLDDALPRFEKFSAEFDAVPALGALITAPDELLRRQAEIGITFTRKDEDRTLLPYALQEGGRLRPTVLAQAMARVSSTPYATHRLLLGPGAGAYLANGGFVPLSPAGEFVLNAKQTIPEVDALNLMTVEMADALTVQDKMNLRGPGKVFVIGTDDDTSGGLARVHAQALAQVLAMPRIHLLSGLLQWVIWIVAALAGFWLVLRVPQRKALLRGAAFIFAGLVICFLAFQSALIWCPPTLPAALLAASALFARVAGRVKGK
jgi:hypothetical protein|uniref:hypothetical protein n=1 Tax=Prosthecobacter sp. TaxID=1965333 RepID=UPI003783C134